MKDTITTIEINKRHTPKEVIKTHFFIEESKEGIDYSEDFSNINEELSLLHEGQSNNLSMITKNTNDIGLNAQQIEALQRDGTFINNTLERLASDVKTVEQVTYTLATENESILTRLDTIEETLGDISTETANAISEEDEKIKALGKHTTDNFSTLYKDRDTIQEDVKDIDDRLTTVEEDHKNE